MSILVVHLTPQGLLFGADRNVTTQVQRQDGHLLVRVEGQSQRPKVLKWPNREAIVGYVGAAQIQGRPTDIWLYEELIGRNLDFTDFGSLAGFLASELDSAATESELDVPLIIHLGGFEPEGDSWRPVVWFIRNTIELTQGGAYICGDHFDCSEELAQRVYFGSASGEEIRQRVETAYFSFRQGYDLPAFNVIDQKLREAMMIIVHGHPNRPHDVPNDLAEWSKHVRLSVNGYAAYFSSFLEPYEQYVGGGADVVWAAWPGRLE